MSYNKNNTVNNQEVNSMNNQEVNTMNNINNQEVVTMNNEKRFVKVTNLARGISAVLCFEDAREARGFADELDVTLLQNSCLFEVSMIWGADAYTLVQIPEDNSERVCLTIIDHDFGTVVEMPMSSYDASYYVAEALNAVFTGTAFEAYAGDYYAYGIEKKRSIVTPPSYDDVCDLRCSLIRDGYDITSSTLHTIELIAPKVYEALPDVSYTFSEANFIVNHLCYDRPHNKAMYDASSTNGVLYRTDDGNFAFRPLTDEEADMSTRTLFEHLNGEITE